MDFEYLIDDEQLKLTIEKKDGRYQVTAGEITFEADIQEISPGVLSIITGGRSHRVFLAEKDGKTHCSLDGFNFSVREPSSDDAGFAEGGEASMEELLMIKAPMPGKVIKICVEEGETVKKNQTLAIVEAMKMENEIKAGLDTVVKKVNVGPGDLVDPSKVLIELKAPD